MYVCTIPAVKRQTLRLVNTENQTHENLVTLADNNEKR